jgi:hypothetical protein
MKSLKIFILKCLKKCMGFLIKLRGLLWEYVRQHFLWKYIRPYVRDLVIFYFIYSRPFKKLYVFIEKFSIKTYNFLKEVLEESIKLVLHPSYLKLTLKHIFKTPFVQKSLKIIFKILYIIFYPLIQIWIFYNYLLDNAYYFCVEAPVGFLIYTIPNTLLDKYNFISYVRYFEINFIIPLKIFKSNCKKYFNDLKIARLRRKRKRSRLLKIYIKRFEFFLYKKFSHRFFFYTYFLKPFYFFIKYLLIILIFPLWVYNWPYRFFSRTLLPFFSNFSLRTPKYLIWVYIKPQCYFILFNLYNHFIYNLKIFRINFYFTYIFFKNNLLKIKLKIFNILSFIFNKFKDLINLILSLYFDIIIIIFKIFEFIYQIIYFLKLKEDKFYKIKSFFIKFFKIIKFILFNLNIFYNNLNKLLYYILIKKFYFNKYVYVYFSYWRDLFRFILKICHKTFLLNVFDIKGYNKSFSVYLYLNQEHFILYLLFLISIYFFLILGEIIISFFFYCSIFYNYYTFLKMIFYKKPKHIFKQTIIKGGFNFLRYYPNAIAKAWFEGYLLWSWHVEVYVSMYKKRFLILLFFLFIYICDQIIVDLPYYIYNIRPHLLSFYYFFIWYHFVLAIKYFFIGFLFFATNLFSFFFNEICRFIVMYFLIFIVFKKYILFYLLKFLFKWRVVPFYNARIPIMFFISFLVVIYLNLVINQHNTLSPEFSYKTKHTIYPLKKFYDYNALFKEKGFPSHFQNRFLEFEYKDYRQVYSKYYYFNKTQLPYPRINQNLLYDELFGRKELNKIQNNMGFKIKQNAININKSSSNFYTNMENFRVRAIEAISPTDTYITDKGDKRFRSLKTKPEFLYSILNRRGYIIWMQPTPPPVSRFLMKLGQGNWDFLSWQKRQIKIINDQMHNIKFEIKYLMKEKGFKNLNELKEKEIDFFKQKKQELQQLIKARKQYIETIYNTRKNTLNTRRDWGRYYLFKKIKKYAYLPDSEMDLLNKRKYKGKGNIYKAALNKHESLIALKNRRKAFVESILSPTLKGKIMEIRGIAKKIAMVVGKSSTNDIIEIIKIVENAPLEVRRELKLKSPILAKGMFIRDPQQFTYFLGQESKTYYMRDLKRISRLIRHTVINQDSMFLKGIKKYSPRIATEIAKQNMKEGFYYEPSKILASLERRIKLVDNGLKRISLFDRKVHVYSMGQARYVNYFDYLDKKIENIDSRIAIKEAITDIRELAKRTPENLYKRKKLIIENYLKTLKLDYKYRYITLRNHNAYNIRKYYYDLIKDYDGINPYMHFVEKVEHSYLIEKNKIKDLWLLRNKNYYKFYIRQKPDLEIVMNKRKCRIFWRFRYHWTLKR